MINYFRFICKKCSAILTIFNINSFIRMLVFWTFMNTVDVILKVFFRTKFFATFITFVIFYSFMNTSNMFWKILYCTKCFTTIFTFVRFDSFMNSFYMNPESSQLTKFFAASLCFVEMCFLRSPVPKNAFSKNGYCIYVSSWTHF